ncbi:MAG: NADPH-dependent FMN reductase [Gammaproteobacteria bacterium CG_4_10_14_0_8_um_filter_38_16]|nr:MAG: NADPH-dependent FMN reductase [Gammaproteobacteria bacterium CG_4_10_14_0_8_um_filter_38_16]PJA04062.1 MAG: NADPH-dependent FMN reductase [Gammaproteobacteria bacterium CG_4_10_14_0_2_um_filter_38_22]PJB10986.1 MAG: NADPH-dependent FMN reductase [Gammaproteobacteria bacterium CG_4_9_14_3_um_filter_38_9]
MKKFKVAIIVGSLRKDSHNLKLAKSISKLGADKLDAHISVIADLPLYNQDLDNQFPIQAVRLKKEIENADAVLFVTPEYNRSVPGVLKNAIDWASRPYGKNSFVKKPAALCGVSVGAIGTACAQNSLKHILSYLDIALMGQPEVYLQFKDNLIDFDGNITDPGTEKFLQGFVNQFVSWIEAYCEK